MYYMHAINCFKGWYKLAQYNIILGHRIIVYIIRQFVYHKGEQIKDIKYLSSNLINRKKGQIALFDQLLWKMKNHVTMARI